MTSTRIVMGSPGDVDAGADMTLTGEVSSSPPQDLRGQVLLIKDQDGVVTARIDFTEFDGETSRTGDCVVKAPLKTGTYTWTAVLPADVADGVPDAEAFAPLSFTVQPHATRIVVWDISSAIECGEKFSIKLGVKCSSECRPDGWAIEVRDHAGKTLATATPGDEPWPGTDALYGTEVDLTAPDTEGRYTWEAKATAAGLDVPHTDCIASFGVTAVPTPECLLTIEAIDMESQAPVEGAKVVVHPYRAFTDERGVAEVRVPKGEYRLFVSGRNYIPFRGDSDVKTDMTIRAEIALDVGLSDADLWS